MKFFAIVSAILIAAVGVSAIAPDPNSACRCPDNCRHKFGDSCKFYKNGNTLEVGQYI